MKIPLSTMDEMFMHLDTPALTADCSTEVRVDAALDEERMRKALQIAVDQHPVTHARLSPWRADAKTYEWLVEGELQIDPLRGIEVEPSRVARRRSRRPRQPRHLVVRVATVQDRARPRCRRRPCHAGSPITSAMYWCCVLRPARVRRSSGRTRRSTSMPPRPIALRLRTPPAPVSVICSTAAASDCDSSRRRGPDSRKLAARHGSPDPGDRVHTMSLPLAPLLKSELRHRLHATVNDVLLAAVHRSIGEWNRQQGGRVPDASPSAYR